MSFLQHTNIAMCRGAIAQSGDHALMCSECWPQKRRDNTDGAMFEWLKRRRHQTEQPRGSTAGTRSRVVVSFDDHRIRVALPTGVQQSLQWDHIGAVNIVTTADGPFAPDLFWLLQSPDRKTSLTIPMGAEGEHDLLRAMQARLTGFDNMAVVEAMSSTGPAGFVVWDPEHVDAAL